MDGTLLHGDYCYANQCLLGSIYLKLKLPVPEDKHVWQSWWGFCTSSI